MENRQDVKNAKERAQSFLFDQNRVAVLVKAAFLLPFPGKRKLIQALAFLPWRPLRLGGLFKILGVKNSPLGLDADCAALPEDPHRSPAALELGMGRAQARQIHLLQQILQELDPVRQLI
jgi:hypothetical protein